jgi:hypothetical protein
MQHIHYGKGEYDHLVSRSVGGVKIKQILYEPDEVYKSTDGHGGNAYKVVLSNKETLCFRNFHSVVEKFGDLDVLELEQKK